MNDTLYKPQQIISILQIPFSCKSHFAVNLYLIENEALRAVTYISNYIVYHALRNKI